MGRQRSSVTGTVFDETRDESNILQADADIYGTFGGVDKGRQSIEAVRLELVRPDPTQPRRQIPPSIRAKWAGEVNPGMILNDWIQAAGMTVGTVKGIINGLGDGTEEEVYQTAIAESLVKLVNLAAEIHRDGLTNAITVSKKGGFYLIETGERRYWAFQLLLSLLGDRKYQTIPAQIVTRNVWRQASENSARQELNAVGMARQLAILIMDLYANNADSPALKVFEELVSPGGCDRAYYAQVEDGANWPIPKGKGQQILSAMGLKNAGQLRQYRSILRLDDAAWVQADEENWTEGRIREYMQSLRPAKPDSVTTVTVSTKSSQEVPASNPYTALGRKSVPIQRSPRQEFEILVATCHSRGEISREDWDAVIKGKMTLDEAKQRQVERKAMVVEVDPHNRSQKPDYPDNGRTVAVEEVFGRTATPLPQRIATVNSGDLEVAIRRKLATEAPAIQLLQAWNGSRNLQECAALDPDLRYELQGTLQDVAYGALERWAQLTQMVGYRDDGFLDAVWELLAHYNIVEGAQDERADG